MSQDQAPADMEWLLLTRYLTGDLSPAEAAAVERWFEADPRHRALLDDLRGVWLATGGETAAWDTDRAVAELRRRALGGERRVAGGREVAPRRPLWSFTFARKRSWAALAAGVAALAIGGGALGLYWMSDVRPTMVPTGRPAPATDVTTRPAQQAEVRLADGTRVTLGPASRLSYAGDFGRRDRTVVLEGEAYFDVVHDGTKPFRVRTAQGVTEDIGTAFVVRTWAEGLQVVVAEGAVVLRPAVGHATRDSMVLTAGQLGRVLRDGRLESARTVQPETYLAWTRGELVFEDAPLAEVAEELSRWHDVDLRVADSVAASRRFSGRLGVRSVEEAVRLVAAVADVTVRRTDRGWVFQGRRSR